MILVTETMGERILLHKTFEPCSGGTSHSIESLALKLAPIGFQFLNWEQVELLRTHDLTCSKTRKEILLKTSSTALMMGPRTLLITAENPAPDRSSPVAYTAESKS